MRDLKYITILIAISGFLFFFKLGDMALTDPDETFYAQTSREMLDAKEWTVPLLFGKPQFEKPPLYYWLIKASYMVLGVNEFAARLPSAVFGMIGVIGVYFLARILFSPKCGFLSGIITATGAQYVILSRGCVTDMVLTVFILLCIAFFIRGWTSPGDKISYVISAVMAALAVLTKGPIGIFLPAVILGAYFLASGGWRRLGEIPWVWCVAVFAAVAVPWYVVVARSHGEAFFNEFIGLHNITRFVKPEHRIGTSPFFYIPVVIGGFAPWSVFLPFAAWEMYKNGKKADSPLPAYRFFLVAWFLVVFLFFSVSRTKLVTYIFPLFPVLSIVTGWFWARVLSAKQDNPVPVKYLYFSLIALAVLATGGVIAGYFVLRVKYASVLSGMMSGAFVFACALAVSVIFLLRGKKGLSFASLVGGLILGSLPVVFLILPAVEGIDSSKGVCEVLLKLAGPNDPIAGESDNRRGVAFYTGRTDIVDVHPQKELMDFVSRKERVWCVLQTKHLDRLKVDGNYVVPPPVYQAGKKILITNRPLEGSEEVNSQQSTVNKVLYAE